MTQFVNINQSHREALSDFRQMAVRRFLYDDDLSVRLDGIEFAMRFLPGAEQARLYDDMTAGDAWRDYTDDEKELYLQLRESAARLTQVGSAGGCTCGGRCGGKKNNVGGVSGLLDGLTDNLDGALGGGSGSGSDEEMGAGGGQEVEPSAGPNARQQDWGKVFAAALKGTLDIATAAVKLNMTQERFRHCMNKDNWSSPLCKPGAAKTNTNTSNKQNTGTNTNTQSNNKTTATKKEGSSAMPWILGGGLVLVGGGLLLASASQPAPAPAR